VAIRSFARPSVARFYQTGQASRREGWAAVARVVARKLDMIAYASVLDDLRAPPGNRLEALKGDLEGLHSIRVNDQWRIIFAWTPSGAVDVDVVDYHR
jgi:proteic killer suppression protein